MDNTFSLTATRQIDAEPSTKIFMRLKRGVDVLGALIALPILIAAGSLVWLINRRFNPGPLFYTQQRMGRDCRPFTIYKFRSMLPEQTASDKRSYADPLETHRITPFGAVMRRTRIDELPQILNILLGDMSFVGPRPDTYAHAVKFAELVPGYRERHTVRPGITGLAQIKVGYAEGIDATTEKVAADLSYIRSMSALSELRIVAGTAWVVISGHGAR